LQTQKSIVRDRSIAIFISGFVLFVTALLFFSFFNIDSASFGSKLTLPTDIKSLKLLKHSLNKIIEANFFNVALAFGSFYVLKHTFSLPGSAILNVLAGDMFGTTFGFLIACICTAVGSSCCYWISYSFCRRLMRKWFASKLDSLSTRVRRERVQGNLFYYLVFVRLLPFAPHSFLNLACPLIDVPFRLFFPSVFFGLMPYNFMTVQAGGLLNEIESLEDVLNFSVMLKILAIGLLVLLPVVLKRFLRKQGSDIDIVSDLQPHHNVS